MLSLLPDFADPHRLCGLGKVYEGELALREFPRLAALMASQSGTVRFRLGFGRDAERRSVIDVEVAGVLPLVCQRCLQSFGYPIETAARLALVNGPDEAERLPSELDPLLVVDGCVAPRDLIEDELLLAVPNAPMHRLQDCPVDLQALNGAAEAAPATADSRPSPFAGLAGLRTSNPSDDEQH
jgi:uncharacterized protein